jgi:hypothetical protein
MHSTNRRRGREGDLPEEEEEDERAGARASRLEPAPAAEAPAGGHEQGLSDGEQEQRADAVGRGDVGVVDAVRVGLLRVRDDGGRAPAALGGDAQAERDHVQEDDHHLHDDGRHVVSVAAAAAGPARERERLPPLPRRASELRWWCSRVSRCVEWGAGE